eukprot:Phypoly_transcript_14960.p1 GENE.Phypoly_transcript_14960~~Phypoly_transcript_14960.p1  ORF type:complete len:300 (+),score=45.21 Phypoly_transcript_14960:30-902(+)
MDLILSIEKIQPIDVGQNSSNPSTTITDKETEKQFSISIKRIAELDGGGTEIRAYDISSLSFAAPAEISSGLNKLSNYSIKLENDAYLSILVRQFEEPSTSYEFAGVASTFPAHTLKVNVVVQKWPFLNLAHSLSIVFDSPNNEASTCFDEDQSGSLRWFVVEVDQVALYGQLLNKSLVDGRVRSASFYYSESEKTLSAVLPHFWDYAELDPSYSVLLDDKTYDQACRHKKKKINTTLIYAIVIPVVVVIILIGTFIFFYPRIKTWLAVRRKTVGSQSVEMSDSKSPLRV